MVDRNSEPIPFNAQEPCCTIIYTVKTMQIKRTQLSCIWLTASVFLISPLSLSYGQESVERIRRTAQRARGPALFVGYSSLNVHDHLLMARRIRQESIRVKSYAVLATAEANLDRSTRSLIFARAWGSYVQNKKSVQEKAAHQFAHLMLMDVVSYRKQYPRQMRGLPPNDRQVAVFIQQRLKALEPFIKTAKR